MGKFQLSTKFNECRIEVQIIIPITHQVDFSLKYGTSYNPK